MQISVITHWDDLDSTSLPFSKNHFFHPRKPTKTESEKVKIRCSREAKRKRKKKGRKEKLSFWQPQKILVLSTFPWYFVRCYYLWNIIYQVEIKEWSFHVRISDLIKSCHSNPQKAVQLFLWLHANSEFSLVSPLLVIISFTVYILIIFSYIFIIYVS